ncbi:MAG: hypothetical protein LQ341_003515 [Variospora aurantia]|nr:MAG: hypothetical protein LQ341_003515 [Variospora aurantia]
MSEEQPPPTAPAMVVAEAHQIDTYHVPEAMFNKHPAKPHLASMDEYKKMYKESIDDPDKFWGNMARQLLTWERDFQTVHTGSFENGDNAWFLQGRLNASYNCVDRHAIKDPDRPAIIYEADEPDQGRTISYGELLRDVSRLSYVLKQMGVKKGDTVALYLPMVPEAVISFLACTRIGAVHSVVFAGFSSDSLRDRVLDAQSKVVITSDEGRRGGKVIGTKKIVDDALKQCPDVTHCLVFKRTGADVPWTKNRDLWWHEEMERYPSYIAPESMNSEDPLFLLYTSGSTGKPKGVMHTTAGYLLGAAMTGKYSFDIHDGDRFFCGGDVGWITGHTYVVYAPLLLGVTTLVFEGTPAYPDFSRYWKVVDKHQVTQFYVAPTALRLLKRAGDSHTEHPMKHLRILASVGEPIAAEVWKWYFEIIGKEEAHVVDTYWQTETGSHVITPLGGVTPTKPGSASLPFFGIEPAIIDPVSGKEIEGNDVEGVLAIKKPWPSMARTVWGAHKRYMDTYLNVYKGYYFTGDGAGRDHEGYYWIRGRVDDVVNVSGHRLSTAEIEAALLEHGQVAEAAVVGINDELQGQAVNAFVALKEGNESSDQVKKDLVLQVRKSIGPFAAPKAILVIDDLPKTRSGKIMRRILRKILSGEEDSLGDTSTLSDPSVRYEWEFVPSSRSREPITYLSLVENPDIRTPSHRLHAFSEFDLLFDLHRSRQQVKLTLEPNHDIIAQGATVTYLNGDGSVKRTESINRHHHRVFRGETRIQDQDGNWMSAGWARITVRRDGPDPLFEGAFTIGRDHHHILLRSNYLKTKHDLDPDVESGGDEYMIAYRDSDIFDKGARHYDELKRSIELGQSCSSNQLNFNADPSHPVFAPAPRQQPVGLWGSTPVNSLFGKRQIDTNGIPSGGNSAGVNLRTSIGDSSGCPATRRVALVGVATDCGYTASFDSEDEVRQNVIQQFQTVSNVYERTFGITLSLANLTTTPRECPVTPAQDTPWNTGCGGGTTITDRLNLFAQWRGERRDQNAFWTLLTNCATGSEVGLAWLGQLCVTDVTRTRGEVVSGANVVARTPNEWQVIAHETGHTFGAVHDCDTSACANQDSVPHEPIHRRRHFRVQSVYTGQQTFLQYRVSNAATASLRMKRSAIAEAKPAAATINAASRRPAGSELPPCVMIPTKTAAEIVNSPPLGPYAEPVLVSAILKRRALAPTRPVQQMYLLRMVNHAATIPPAPNVQADNARLETSNARLSWDPSLPITIPTPATAKTALFPALLPNLAPIRAIACSRISSTVHLAAAEADAQMYVTRSSSREQQSLPLDNVEDLLPPGRLGPGSAATGISSSASPAALVVLYSSPS